MAMKNYWLSFVAEILEFQSSLGIQYREKAEREPQLQSTIRTAHIV